MKRKLKDSDKNNVQFFFCGLLLPFHPLLLIASPFLLYFVVLILSCLFLVAFFLFFNVFFFSFFVFLAYTYEYFNNNRFTVQRNIHYWFSGSALSFFYLSAGSEREKYNAMR